MVWHNFSNHEKISTSTTFSTSFLRSLLPPDKYILRPGISFKVKTADIDNKYDKYSKTCADE